MKNLNLLFLLCALNISSLMTSANNKASEHALSGVDKKFFIENKGQWSKDVLFLCRMKGLDAWITKTGINYTFFKIERNHIAQQEDWVLSKFNREEPENSTILGHRVIMDFVGSNTSPSPEGKQRQEGYYNYLIGNDPRKHASNVGLYKEALVKDIYKGIDIRYYYENGALRYDFLVAPSADPSQIVFKLRGQYNDYLKNNNLAFTTRFGEVSISDLYTYQDNKPVASRFVKNGNMWQIALGKYESNKPLVIDPLVYSTYLGANTNDDGKDIAVDGTGNAYVTGYTISGSFDITAGSFQTTNKGDYDIFVTKLNSTGSGLIYSTYLGGSDYDGSESIAVDDNNCTYVCGTTSSLNFPITIGSFQSNYGGGTNDAFITKLNSTGTGLVYSTFLGGSDYESCGSIVLDDSTNAYLVGSTASSDFDITLGVFQSTFEGISDAFVTKLNPNGNGLVYSTYIGGSNAEWISDVAIDGNGNAYLVATTRSTDYDITAGAFQTNYGGGLDDIVVTKLNYTGTSIEYSTYIGGTEVDYGNAIIADSNGNAFIAGYTYSSDFDITNGSFQNIKDGNSDAFVTKINSNGTGLIYSTFIGGSGIERCHSITIAGNGNAYITGETRSIDFDVTVGAYQSNFEGISDAFITKLNASGTGLEYSTFLGGSLNDIGYKITIDNNEFAYILALNIFGGFDTTAGVFQSENGGDRDVVVVKFGCTNSVGVTDFDQKNTLINVYPNPANDYLTLESKSMIKSIQLEDLSGRKIDLSFANGQSNKTKVPIASLPSGMYFIRVNGQQAVKWIKE